VSRLPHFVYNQLTDGEVVRLTHLQPFTPRKMPGTHFCWRLSQPQGHSAARRIGSVERSNDLIGVRTHDLLACGITPDPTTLPHAPQTQNIYIINDTTQTECFLYRYLQQDGIINVELTPLLKWKMAEMQKDGPLAQKQWKQETVKTKTKKTGYISDYNIFQWIVPCCLGLCRPHPRPFLPLWDLQFGLHPCSISFTLKMLTPMCVKMELTHNATKPKNTY
jgi:hypothetical protein